MSDCRRCNAIVLSLRGMLLVFLCASYSLCGFGRAHAQIVNFAKQGPPPEAGLELLQEDPHDMIFFKDSSGGGWIKVELLELPNREMPATPSGSLTFRVMGIPNEQFVSQWEDIAKIDFWEKRLERESAERIKREDFKGAYPFVAVLIRDYPDRPGLKILRCEFLWRDAIKRAQSGELGSTLAMLEELRRYAPEYEPAKVIKAIGGITDQLMAQLVKTNQLSLAQRLLARLEKDYARLNLASIPKWNAEFLAMSESLRDQALAAAKQKDFRAARTLARQSVNVKPDLPGGVELVRKIDEVYPLVQVGVLQQATVLDPTRMDNWASRRSGRLVYRVLFEMKGAGPEGGDYQFLFGGTQQNPARTEFSLFLEPEKLPDSLSKVNGSYLADMLARRAQLSTGLYFSPWAAAVQSIGMVGPKQINCFLRRPNVLPAALLQIPVDGAWLGREPGAATGDYRRDVVEQDLVRYVLAEAPRTPNQPKEIVEVRTASAADGVRMLVGGEVDVLDQLFPADAVRLSKNKDIRVVQYPLPSVHMLVPCGSDHAYLAERTFRRALVYGTNRADILKGELLEQAEIPGCQVLSGPFPAGVEPNDPLGYAYDKRILPREYEPRLAKLLIVMTTKQFEAEANRKKDTSVKPPELMPIRIAHPADSLSISACEAIRTQWELLDLRVELIPLPAGQTIPEKGTADLVYVAAAIWEPIIDARRLLGPEGLAGSTDQLIGLGLRRLEESKNWKDARDRLLDLHAIAHHELPVIPLWQMVDSYAHTRALTGIGVDVVSLYQNAEKWRLSP